MVDEPGEDDGRMLVWALTPSRLVAQWASVAVLVALLAVEGWHAAVRGIDHVVLLPVAAAAVLALTMLLRGVVAVVVDATDGSVLLFRAAGGTVRTRLERIQRLDYGRWHALSPARDGQRVPIRIVTADGTARLSWLFPHPDEVADALTELSPRVQVDL